MRWLKRVIRSPVQVQVVLAVLQLATQIVKHAGRKRKAKK